MQVSVMCKILYEDWLHLRKSCHDTWPVRRFTFGKSSRSSRFGEDCGIVRRFGLPGVVILDDTVVYRTEEGSVPGGHFSRVEEDIV